MSNDPLSRLRLVVRHMALFVVLLTACRSNTPVQRTSSSPSPTKPRFATVEGYVTTNYLMPSGKCKDLSTGGPGIQIEAGLARGLIDKTEGREVEVRDETGSVIA